MQIQKLSDQDLLSHLNSLVRRERELLTEILRHLREVGRRRLFSGLGYKSLFEYAVKELGYSEDQAYRRINAMRLMKELPQVEEKLAQGELNLSTLSVAGQLFKLEEMSVDRKLEVVEALTGKSRREAEVIARKISGSYRSKPEVTRTLEGGSELRMPLSPTLEEKIARIKGLRAHSDPGISTGELFEKLCDEYLASFEKKMTPKKSAPPRKVASKGRVAIPVAMKRAVWQRDHGRCRNCGSRHGLEIDHHVPVALGGETGLINLRLLCRNCNQRAAIVVLGLNHMNRFLERSVSR